MSSWVDTDIHGMTIPTTPETAQIEAPLRVPRYLNALDRCDQCGAQAYVAAEVKDVDLMFCAHHFRKYEDKLRSAADFLLDERWVLEEDHRNRSTGGAFA